MIITHFPNTLGGVQLVKGRFTQTLDSTLFGFSKNCRTQISFEKLVNYLGEGKPQIKKLHPIIFLSTRIFKENSCFALISPPWLTLQSSPNPQPFLATTKGDSPLETPNLCFSFYFLFLLLVVISFGYLAIYTNEYLLLLNNVDRFD